MLTVEACATGIHEKVQNRGRLLGARTGIRLRKKLRAGAFEGRTGLTGIEVPSTRLCVDDDGERITLRSGSRSEDTKAARNSFEYTHNTESEAGCEETTKAKLATAWSQSEACQGSMF